MQPQWLAFLPFPPPAQCSWIGWMPLIGVILPYGGGETLALGSSRPCEAVDVPFLSVFEAMDCPALVEGVFSLWQGLATSWCLRCLPTQTLLWYCNTLIQLARKCTDDLLAPIRVISVWLFSLLWLAEGPTHPCNGYILALQQHCLPVLFVRTVFPRIFLGNNQQQENHLSSHAPYGV